MQGSRWAAAVALTLGLWSCSLVVDVSNLDDGECPQGTKLCPGEGCVDTSSPAYGCSNLESCLPCPNAERRITICGADGQCGGRCLVGFGCADCGTNILTDERNCGGCCDVPGEPCSFRCDPGLVCRGGRCMGRPDLSPDRQTRE